MECTKFKLTGAARERVQKLLTQNNNNRSLMEYYEVGEIIDPNNPAIRTQKTSVHKQAVFYLFF